MIWWFCIPVTFFFCKHLIVHAILAFPLQWCGVEQVTYYWDSEMKWNGENVVHRYVGCLINRDNRKSGINERTGSCIRIDTRILTILFMFFFAEWTVYKRFHLYWKFFQKEKNKTKDPSTINFSYQKYINGSMATQREKTHIQYPNMYKLYVSWN